MISLALAKIVNLWSFFKVIKKYHYTNMRQSKQLCIRKTFCPNIVPVLTLMTHKNVYVSIICFRLCYFGVVTSYLILKHSSTLFDWWESVFAVTCTCVTGRMGDNSNFLTKWTWVTLWVHFCKRFSDGDLKSHNLMTYFAKQNKVDSWSRIKIDLISDYTPLKNAKLSVTGI